MKNITHLIMSILIITLALGFTTKTALAGDVSQYGNGPWLAFSWWGTLTMGCKPADPDSLPCFLAEGTMPADAPPWFFEAGEEGATVVIVDVVATGDWFALYDYGVLVGNTSDPFAGTYCGIHPEECLDDPNASSGSFDLGPGLHELSIVALEDSYPVGAAYFAVRGDVIGGEPPPTDSDGDGILDEEDSCPNSYLTPTVVVGDCDSGVTNVLLADGCTIADLIAQCQPNINGVLKHGVYVKCVQDISHYLKKDGVISGSEQDAITHCAAKKDKTCGGCKGYEAQSSYDGDCTNRPPGSICAGYDDEYVWLIYSPVHGRRFESDTCTENPIQVVEGWDADYYHILNTDCVRTEIIK